MEQGKTFLILLLEKQRFAIDVAMIERVVRAVAITPIPDTSASIIGVINLEGRIIPVLSLRKRFHLPERDVGLKDRLVIIKTDQQQTIALIADWADEIKTISAQEITEAVAILPGLKTLGKIATVKDELILVKDLDNLLWNESDRMDFSWLNKQIEE